MCVRTLWQGRPRSSRQRGATDEESEEIAQLAKKLGHQYVPKNAAFSKDLGSEIERGQITTLMLPKIPNHHMSNSSGAPD